MQHNIPIMTNTILGVGSKSVNIVDIAVMPMAKKTAPLNRIKPFGSGVPFLFFVLISGRSPIFFSFLKRVYCEIYGVRYCSGMLCQIQ